MSAGPPTLHLLLPGDPATRTGGYGYARRLAEALEAAGRAVRVHRLSEAFPHPAAADLAHAEHTLAALDDGAIALVDGLACGAMPQLAMRHAGRLRLLALVHHPLALEAGLDADTAARLAHGERRALAAVRQVVTTSAHTAGVLARDYGVPPPMLSVVAPGTNPAPPAAGSGGPDLHLLCVATLTPRKGHALLLDALARLPRDGWRLTCAGSETRDPRTAAAVRARMRALELADRVCLRGEVDDATLATLYDGADAFVLPTALEGYGMVLAEAVARGLPVVSTRAGAVPDTVGTDAALLVPPGDVEALAGALARLLADTGLRARLAAGARARAAALPTWDQAAARMNAVLDAAARG